MSPQSLDPPCVINDPTLQRKSEHPRNKLSKKKKRNKKTPMLRKPVTDAEGKMRQMQMWPVLCRFRVVFWCFGVFLAVLRPCSPHVHLTVSGLR